MRAFKTVVVPGQQRSLFDQEPSGQMRLFDVCDQADKPQAKRVDPSLLERIADEIELREIQNSPLAGQRDLFS